MKILKPENTKYILKSISLHCVIPRPEGKVVLQSFAIIIHDICSHFQTSLIGGGPPSSGTGDLVTWSNLFAGGLKNQTSASTAAASSNNDTGIITMEDEDDEEELSDQEMSGPADSSSAFGALFTSFAGPSLGSPTGASSNNSNANTTSEAAKSGTADERLEGSKPFEVLRDLLCHHAHLAVFMNYVISNSDPSALVIYFHYHSFFSISLHHFSLYKASLSGCSLFLDVFFPIKSSAHLFLYFSLRKWKNLFHGLLLRLYNLFTTV